MVEERIIKFDERTEKHTEKHTPADFSKTAQILSNSSNLEICSNYFISGWSFLIFTFYLR
jgi:hypothetical protein